MRYILRDGEEGISLLGAWSQILPNIDLIRVSGWEIIRNSLDLFPPGSIQHVRIRELEGTWEPDSLNRRKQKPTGHDGC